MADGRGAFLSFLDEIDRPGQVVRNLLRGNAGAALRHTGQFGLNAIDALLPGDWLPNDVAEAEDYVSGGELVGLKEPGLLKTIADLGIGIGTDPLSFVPGRAVAQGLGKAGEVVGKGVSKLPKPVQDGIKATGVKVRKTFGAQRESAENKAIRQAASAARSSETQAGMAATQAALNGLNDHELDAVGDLLDNFKWQDGKLAGKLSDIEGADLATRAQALSGIEPDRLGAILQAAEDMKAIGQSQKARPGIFGTRTVTTPAVTRRVGTPQSEDLSRLTAEEAEEFKRLSTDDMGAEYGLKDPVSAERLREMRRRVTVPSTMTDEIVTPAVTKEVSDLPDEYLMRSYSGIRSGDEAETALAMGRTASSKGRTLPAQENVAEFLAKNKDVKYERNALVRGAKRAEQQGVMAQRAEIGKALHGDDFKYADPEHQKLVNAKLDEMHGLDAEGTQQLIDAYRGLGARSAPMELLAKANRYMKPLMTAGAFIPKFGFNVRNRLSGPWQALSNPEGREVSGKLANPMTIGRDLLGALDDGIHKGFGFQRLAKDEMTGKLDALDAALSASQGSAQNAMNILKQGGHEDVAELLRTGVLDGFVRSEDLISRFRRTGWKKSFLNTMEWPAHIMQGVESRMRAGMALELVKNGKSFDEAARVTKESLYDYSIAGVENRAARDVIPFFQFTAKAIPQQAKFLAEKPYVATGIASMLGNDPDEALYPYMEGKLNVALGADAQGNQQYVSGMGMPFEALNWLPNPSGDLASLGRQVEQNVVGSMNPLLKTAFAAISGEDPYFGTQYGSYDKLPVIGEAGAIGRGYQMAAGTGLLAPIDQPLRFLDDVLDNRKSPGVRALDVMTGANVVSVDPDKALQQRLQADLETNPDVQQVRSLYTKSDDPETQAALAELNAAKARLRQKRQAEAAKRQGVL